MTRDKLVRIELRALRVRALENKVLVNGLLREHGIGGVLRFMSRNTVYRMLKLETWSRKYKVSIAYILRVLIPVWKAVAERKQRKFKLIPAQLTGHKSEEILKQRIEEDYPDRQNVRDWKWSERERALVLERDFAEVEERTVPLLSLDHVKRYQKRILRKRRALDEAVSAKGRKRRTYRGNPWL